MEFLKPILGEDLYKQVETKVNEYNTKTENKEKQIKIADLGTGEYVSKNKYDTLQTDLENTKTSLESANTTIADLKKNNKDNADLQNKIANYESEKTNLETKYKEEKSEMIKKMAIKDALYNEKAKHPELLISKFDLSKIILDEENEKVLSGIEEQIKSNKETYKDLFGETEQQNGAYHYTPNGGSQNNNSGATDFVGIIKENQARKI